LKRQLRAAAVAAVALLPLSVSAQQPSTSLTAVARQLGFHYAYLGPDEAVALSRPGLVVVLRPGEPLFEVNDRSIPVDGPSPTYNDGEIYVSARMVAELRRLIGPTVRVARASTASVRPEYAVTPTGPITIDALSAAHIEGDQALHVEGQATPNAAITLTLMARLSSSIPDVVVSRSHVSANSHGVFQSRVAVAPVYFANSQLIVVAASDSDTTRSVTAMVPEDPNSHTKVPSEDIPRAMR
jgi:hypothetical protein